MTGSWTVSFFKHNLQHMTLGSVIRLWIFYRRSNRPGKNGPATLALTLRNRIRGVVLLRPETSDMATFKEVVLQGVYDDVCRLLDDCQYIVDLGANIGLATLMFATRYPDAKVVSVEPDTDNFRALNRNLAASKKTPQCQSRRLAVWSSNQAMRTDNAMGKDRFSSIRVVPARDATSDSSNAVEGATLKSILGQSGFPRVDLLKIDIEGAEVELLADSSNWIDFVQAIAIEFHDDSRERADFDRRMADSGFKIVVDGDHTVLAIRQRPGTP